MLTFRTGTLSELKDFAREFAAGQVDIIVAVATEAVEIAQQATQAHPIPILMTGVSDPVKYGFVQSLARPGGYITGVSHQVVQGSGKRVELFKEMLPGLKRLLTIRQPDDAPPEKSMEEIRDAARSAEDWNYRPHRPTAGRRYRTSWPACGPTPSMG